MCVCDIYRMEKTHPINGEKWPEFRASQLQQEEGKMMMAQCAQIPEFRR